MASATLSVVPDVGCECAWDVDPANGTDRVGLVPGAGFVDSVQPTQHCSIYLQPFDSK